MTTESILNLSEWELQEHFWEWVSQETLITSVTRFKDEVLWLIRNWKIQSIKSVYNQLNKTSLYHQWRIYLAFWDDKWAEACFKKVWKQDESYWDASYQLTQLLDDSSYYCNIPNS